MSNCLRIVLLLILSANTAFAASGLPAVIVVTSVKVGHGTGKGLGTTAEVTINNALTIREISVQKVGGRTLLKFPQSISKRGKVFPQVRLTSNQAREAVYSAIEKESASSRWEPLKFEVKKFTRYGKKSALKAFALVEFGGGIEVECRVVSGKRGLYVGWPARKAGNEWVDQVLLDDEKLKDDVEAAVIAAYEK